ncbi:hypothetical protein AAFF_G00265960 [Aldrovandia affinis]|uniref:Uncharacterized protein n=1 Tax=Aldrovandia affinis TaxID=143900 RepID=A0AAD7W2C1_9TELE|nr:hypothetical protein AAFF_G00265960 [Aldrovandia affinis]
MPAAAANVWSSLARLRGPAAGRTDAADPRWGYSSPPDLSAERQRLLKPGLCDAFSRPRWRKDVAITGCIKQSGRLSLHDRPFEILAGGVSRVSDKGAGDCLVALRGALSSREGALRRWQL